MSESITRKLNVPLIIGDKNVDLDEPDYKTDISIGLPPENVPDETKRPPKPKNTIALF